MTTNQYRENPGAGKYQNPAYQPGGFANLHNQSVRSLFNKITASTAGCEFTEGGKGENSYEWVEPSTEIPGEVDTYMFTKMKVDKNDSFKGPFRSVVVRLWLLDAERKQTSVRME